MDNVVFVAKVDRFENLLDTSGSVPFRVELSGYDIFKELATGDQVKDQVVVVLIVAGLVHPHNVLVSQLLANARLALKLLEIALGQLCSRNDLDGIRFAIFTVYTPFYHGKGA